MTNKFRGPDPKPDPHIARTVPSIIDEEHFGTRHPTRFEAKQATIGSTQTQQRARAHVHNSNAFIVIANNTNTALAFDVEDFDNVGLHDNVTFNSRLTVPSTGKITGLWLVHGHIIWAGAAGGTRELDLKKNGSATVASAITPSLGAGAGESMDVWLYFNDPTAGDYYEMFVFQDSGGNLNLLASPEKTYFEIIQLW